MLTIKLNMYHAVALGAFLFWTGGIITDKVRLLNRYCIPAPLVGGLCFSILNCILYSMGIASAWLKEKNVSKWFKAFIIVAVVFICLATMFIKQHSCIDVIFAILLGVIINYIVYHTCFLVKAHDFIGKLVRENRDLSPSLSRDIHSTAKDAEI